MHALLPVVNFGYNVIALVMEAPSFLRCLFKSVQHSEPQRSLYISTEYTCRGTPFLVVMVKLVSKLHAQCSAPNALLTVVIFSVSTLPLGIQRAYTWESLHILNFPLIHIQ